MRGRTAALVLLLAGPALGFDSVCFLAPTTLPDGSVSAPPCTPGPEAARNRWRGPSDEHRALLELSRIVGGLPSGVSDDFTLTVFTGDRTVPVGAGTGPSLEPLNFFDATSTQTRTMSVPEFAQLPDHGFALWDWARGLELCPLDAALPAPASAVDCHDFATHMGAVNSNHFVPQAQAFYQYYHALALDRAAACADAERRITSGGGNPDDFRSFLRACEDEALVIEATGQHFLQDAWSTGHMWERWGSPDLADFTGISQALLVAMTSGLIHGAKAVLEDIPVSHPDIAAALATAGYDLTQYTWNDPLCAPTSDVVWMGPGMTAPALGAGDLFLTNLIAGQGASFPDQYRRLFSCGAAGLRAVYAAAGAQHGPLGPLAPGLDAPDPGSDACFAQRATNGAMARGIGLDFTDPMGTPQRIELNSQLAAFLVPALGTQVGATVTPFTVVQYRIEMGFIVTQAKLRALFEPDATDLAQGGLGSFLGVDRNLVYVNRPLAPYVDPPLPWPAASGSGGDAAERATWLARVFHRAHAVEWCNRFTSGAPDFLDVDALRSKVETLRSIGAGADEIRTACTACQEFAARHLRVGHDATDYDTTREPLCHFLADDPSAAQYVYVPGAPGDAVDALATRYCGCGERRFVQIAGPPLVRNVTFSVVSPPSINEAGTVAFKIQENVFTGRGGERALGDYVQITGLPGQPAVGNTDLGSFVGSSVAFSAILGPSFTTRGVFSGAGGPLDTKILGVQPRTPAMNSAGVVTFFAVDERGAPAIAVASGGTRTFVAQNRMPFSDGSMLDNVTIEEPDINDAGQVAFAGSFPAASGCDDFVLRTSEDVPVRVAAGGVLDGCAGPEGIDGPFAMNAGGQVAWLATLDTGARAVFLGGAPVVVGRDDILDIFDAVALNDGGLVVFLREQFTTPEVKGIYAGGEKVIETGDLLFGSEVRDLAFDRDGLNDAGQIAFAAVLADGRIVAARADP